MKQQITSLVVTLALLPAAFAQNTLTSNAASTATVLQQDSVTPSAPTAVLPPEMILRDGTPVRIRLCRTLSSEQVKTGDQVDFDVLDDVTVAGRIVIAKGAKALGAITEAEHKRRMGRGGRVNLTLDYVRLDDGTKVALRGERDTKGGGHVGAMTAGMTAAVVLGFGLPAPLFLFMHGKEALVPQGTELTVYANGDTHINLSTTVAAWR